MKRNAFSLMEMMVVLLITSIVAAASAPMINKKLVQGAASSGNASPWVRINQSGAIAYSFSGAPGEVAMIGTNRVQDGIDNGLYLKNVPLSLQEKKEDPLQIRLKNKGLLMTNEIPEEDTNSVAIGYSSNVEGNFSTAVGYMTFAKGRAVAVGSSAKANEEEAVAIGVLANAVYINTIAVGGLSNANGERSVAIGRGAKAVYNKEDLAALAEKLTVEE